MRNFNLAIDTSISNGSFSIWHNDLEMDSIIGSDLINRSTDIIETIAELLDSNEIKLTEINNIIYTNGPGSYTGIRVGVSTVLGLSFATRINSIKVSVFEAFSILAEETDKINVAAISIGSNDVAFKIFGTKVSKSNLGCFKDKPISVLNINEFLDLINKYEDIGQIILNSNLHGKLKGNTLMDKNQLIVASDNVSALAYKYYLLNKHIENDRKFSILYANSFNKQN